MRISSHSPLALVAGGPREGRASYVPFFFGLISLLITREVKKRLAWGTSRGLPFSRSGICFSLTHSSFSTGRFRISETRQRHDQDVVDRVARHLTHICFFLDF